MSLRDWLFGSKPIGVVPSGLAGCWHFLRGEMSVVEPGTEIDIRDDGRMLYSVPNGNRWQIMKLTYRVEGDTLITDQPSAPSQERTRFQIQPDDELLLEFDGKRTWFRRGPKRAPDA